MRKAAKLFLGRHDFSPFCASGSSATNTVRTIKKIAIKKYACYSPFTACQALIIIDITADGFLYNMVRSIAGTLIEVGRGKMPPEFIRGPTAPASGLFLVKVDY